MRQVSLTLNENLIKWIDSERHNMSRSKLINAILDEKYKKFKASFDWEEENRLADEDFKAGRYKDFTDVKKAIKWLKS
ncbi:MAG: hypothetical protein LBD17_04585 [Endomicrobium sp.]|jgi:hypothetical protein|nr:hypothetical protein [Endomicrobium sp.]